MDYQSLVGRLRAAVGARGREWGTASGLKALEAEIDEIRAGFEGLPRAAGAGATVNELVSLKFRIQQWRAVTGQGLIDALCGLAANASSKDVGNDEGGAARVELATIAFRALARLQFKPSAAQLKRLLEAALLAGWKAPAARYFAEVAERGALEALGEALKDDPSLAALAGPGIELPIVANAPSRCGFAKWSAMEEFSCYQYEGEGVRYRGLTFQPGDVLVTQVNRDGNGVYTALCEPRAYGYHLGIFAVLEHEGEHEKRRLPVVLETYKLGVRAVPLSTFLSPAFTSYAEVCRRRELPAGIHARFNAVAATLPSSVLGYNFDTEDPDRRYIACTSIANVLFERAGLAPLKARSRYLQDERIRSNMGKFDFLLPAMLSLTDFIVDPAMRVVGAVDNGHFERNVTRELCEREFVETFREGELDLSLLPVMFALNRFGIRQMRAGTWLGKLIGLPYGLNEVNLPKGPEKVLAIIELYEHVVEAGVRKSLPKFRALLASGQAALLDIDELADRSEAREIAGEALAPIRRAFRPVTEPLIVRG